MNSPSIAPEKPCPICGKPALTPFRPFCGQRCADVDLNRWLSGVYTVPVKDDDEDERKPATEPTEDRD